MIKAMLLAAPALAAAFSPGLCGIAAGQSTDNRPAHPNPAFAAAPDRDSRTDSSSLAAVDAFSSAVGDPPSNPGAPALAGSRERPGSAADMIEGWPPLSRIAVGSGLGPLGIGIRGATVLTEYFDARLDGNLFLFNPNFQVEGFNVNSHFHLASIGAKLDWYPTNSVWRISPGLMLYNGNRFSARMVADPGSSFDLNGTTYYSADPKKLPGATPMAGTVTLGLNRNKAAFIITGGFGRFIPRSHRHWSFPSEFGVAFTGSPTLDVKLSGWVCTDDTDLNCSSLSALNSPVAIQFNNSLNTALAKWRHSLGAVSMYPILTAGVMYSFDFK